MKRTNGSGSVQQLPSGRWRVRLSLADGTRRSTTISAETREDAERICNAILYNLEQEAGPISLRGLGQRWLDEREIGKESLEGESRVWRNHVLDEAFEWADTPITAITRADCVKWLDYLATKKAQKPSAWKKGGSKKYFDHVLSKQTRVHCRNVLKLFFDWAVKKGFVRDNPATGLEVRALASEIETDETWTFLTADEIELVRKCDAIPAELRDLFTFAIFTGMRQGELWALQWKHLHLGEQPRCEVRRSHDRSTKSKKVRHFPLFVPAIECLLRQARRVPHDPESLVWPDENGDRREERTDAGWRDTVGAKSVRVPGWKTTAGIKRRVRFHDLRHTCASHLVMGTWGRAWSLVEVQKFLAHASIDVTERYAHLSPEHLHRAAAQTAVGHAVSNTPLRRLDTTPPKAPSAEAIGEENPSGAGYRIRTDDSELGNSVATPIDSTPSAERVQRVSSEATGDLARRFLFALAENRDDAEQLMLALVASVVLSGQHVELAIQVAEGGPFRWRRATELAVRVISTGAALKEAAG
jgi:integrase